MRKLAITGAGGFVAGSVIQQATSDWQVHALSNKPPLAERPGLVWHTLDLKQPAEVRGAIEAIRPAAVIHAAAIGDIDLCEREPVLARTVNVELTSAVAESCRRLDCRMIFVSSDNVFDGRRGYYVEEDSPSPINEYARTKAAGEALLEEGVDDLVIARTAIVMGFGLLGGGNSFLERTVPMFREGRTIHVPPEEIRTPIDVVTLGRALLELAANDLRGTIHLAGNDALDRVALTRRLAERLGFSASHIVPRSPESIPGRAPRPRDVALNNHKARSLLRTPMLHFDAALELILELSEDRLRGGQRGTPAPNS